MKSTHLRLMPAPPTMDACTPPSRVVSYRDRAEHAYREHQEHVFYLAMRYGAGDRAWAEDATQDVFIRLLQQFEQGREIHNVGAWLYRTTTNRCLTKLKRERFLESPVLRFLLGTKTRKPATPEDLGLRDEQARLVMDVLHAASPKERACFYLYHIDQLGMTEIGEMIGHSKSYVSKLISRIEARVQARHREEHEHA